METAAPPRDAPAAAGQARLGRVIGLGLGPGDPELMSVRAHRLLRETRQVAYFRKAGRSGQARAIVEGLLHPDAQEIPLEYPVTTEIGVEDPAYNGLLAPFYADCAARVAARAEGEDVVVLCEGDPFFYGSFMHLHSRLPAERVEVVPGIPGMAGCWTATGLPITWGDDVLTVLPATLPEAELARRIADTDALVVMKIGRNLPRLCRALAAAGRFAEAWLVVRGTMPGERVVRLRDHAGEVPYFSIVIVHGRGRRP